MNSSEPRVIVQTSTGARLEGRLLPSPRAQARILLDVAPAQAELQPGQDAGLIAETEGTVRIWRATVMRAAGTEVLLQVQGVAAAGEVARGDLARVAGPASFRPVHADGTTGAWVPATLVGVGDMEISLRIPAHVAVPRRMEVRFAAGGGGGVAHGRAYADGGGLAVGGLDDRPIRSVARVTACHHVAGGEAEVRLAITRIAPDDRQRLAALAISGVRQAA